MSVQKEPLVVALGGRVLALDKDTGTELWRNDMHGSGLSWVALAVSSTCVLASASASRVFCIDKFSGATLWTAKTKGIGRATILLDEGTVFVSKSGWIDCFNCQTGALLWSSDVRSVGKGTAALGITNVVIQADG